MTEQLIIQFSKNPKKLFLIDAIGAFVSAILILILSNFNLGISTQNLTGLIAFAIGLSIYSIICFFSVHKKHIRFIRILTVTNLLYCILTFVMLIFHFSNLTIISLLYFPLELIIISLLIVFELKVSKSIETLDL